MVPVNGVTTFLGGKKVFLFLPRNYIVFFCHAWNQTASSQASALCRSVSRWKSEPGVCGDLSVIERRPGPFQDVIKSAVCLKSRWTWTLMRTRLSCKPWLEEVSHKGVTVSPGQWHSPPLCGVETASLEAAADTRTLLKQTGLWDRNDICSCCEHGGQNVPCLWFEASKFLALVTPVLTFRLTFMPVARKKKCFISIFFRGRVDLI